MRCPTLVRSLLSFCSGSKPADADLPVIQLISTNRAVRVRRPGAPACSPGKRCTIPLCAVQPPHLNRVGAACAIRPRASPESPRNPRSTSPRHRRRTIHSRSHHSPCHHTCSRRGNTRARRPPSSRHPRRKAGRTAGGTMPLRCPPLVRVRRARWSRPTP